jgi:hypothetical protein
MDQEIATLKLNINQLAGITGVHRQTVAARLKNVSPAQAATANLSSICHRYSDRTDDPDGLIAISKR